MQNQIHDRVLSLGTSAVGTARRLTTVYDSRGMVQTVTTWDDPRVGFGSVQNQVLNAYNDFGQQTASCQSHSGSANISTSPKVQYGYADGSANTIRMTGMTYPNGRSVSMNYGTANGINDASSRIESMTDTGVTLTRPDVVKEWDDNEVAPLFERLGMSADDWCRLVKDFGRWFSVVAGQPQKIDEPKHQAG